MTNAARIASLEDALGRGVLTVESDGERVTYRSTTDLRNAIDYFNRAEAAAVAPGGVQRPASTLAVYSDS